MMDRFSLEPMSRKFGFDRGKPIDRYYVENFLIQNKNLIHGHILEIGDNTYTKKFGSKIAKSDILDIAPSSVATIVGDLATGQNIPTSTFDCIILTQVIHIIYDIKSTIKHTINALKPGGTLLLTTAGISQYCGCKEYGDYWRFTNLSLYNLLKEHLSDNDTLIVEHHGNLPIAKAFLDGLALHEVPNEILDHQDHDYQVVLTAIVKKSEKK